MKLIKDDGTTIVANKIIYSTDGEAGIIGNWETENLLFSKHYLNKLINETIENDHTILLKLFNKNCSPERHGDWIDLKSARAYTYSKGDLVKVMLGVAMELPLGHEAYVIPRSSTIEKYSLRQGNGDGMIDEPFNGPNDEWSFKFKAEANGVLKEGERICQFRIHKKMGIINFKESNLEHNEDRGGYGTSGK